MISDYSIVDGSKIHLMISPVKVEANTFVNELRLLASKWVENPNERELFVKVFQAVKFRKEIKF